MRGVPTHNRRAASPVIGIVLLVAVTVALSVGIGFTVLDNVQSGPDGPPQASVNVIEDVDSRTVAIEVVSLEAAEWVGVPETYAITENSTDDTGAAAGYHTVDSPGDVIYAEVVRPGDTMTVIAERDGAQGVVYSASTPEEETEYAYREWNNGGLIEVTNPNTVDLTDHQVKVTVPYDTAMQDDFSDIRFTQDINGERRALPFWIEDYTAGSEATVWVEAAQLPAGETTELNLHYGNDWVSSPSDGKAAFVHFTGFEKSQKPKWTLYSSDWGGEYKWGASKWGRSDSSNTQFFQTSDYTRDTDSLNDGFIAETRAMTQDSSGGVGVVARTDTEQFYAATLTNGTDGAGNCNCESLVRWDEVPTSDTSTWATRLVDYGDVQNPYEDWTVFGLVYDGTDIRGSYERTRQSGSHTVDKGIHSVGVSAMMNDAPARHTWWLIREYASDEPSTSVDLSTSPTPKAYTYTAVDQSTSGTWTGTAVSFDVGGDKDAENVELTLTGRESSSETISMADTFAEVSSATSSTHQATIDPSGLVLSASYDYSGDYDLETSGSSADAQVEFGHGSTTIESAAVSGGTNDGGSWSGTFTFDTRDPVYAESVASGGSSDDYARAETFNVALVGPYQTGDINYSIVDADGNTVDSGSIDNLTGGETVTVSVSNLSPGSYELRFASAGLDETDYELSWTEYHAE